MPAAHVQPLHPREHVAKCLRHRVQGDGQRVGILLAQGVEVQPVQQREQRRGHLRVPLGAGHAQAAPRRAGVVNRVALLGGAFRVDAQPQALPGSLRGGAEFLQLPGAVEHDVIRPAQKLVEFIRPVGRAEHVGFPPGHGFPAQPGLVQPAGLGARQVRGQDGVQVVVGEGLLGQENFRAGALRHAGKDFPVAFKLRLVQHVAGGGQEAQPLRVKVCEGRTMILCHVSPPARGHGTRCGAGHTCPVRPGRDRGRTPPRCARPSPSTGR